MRLFVVLLVPVMAGYGQKPVVSPGGVVNAASYATGGLTGKSVAPGSIVSIFGSSLAVAAQSASAFPLPTALAGTSVTVNGILAPLLYVSPSQINVQLPTNYPLPFTGLQLVVSTPAGASDPVPVDARENFGIFTLDGSGCGRGAVLNVAGDGSVSVNSPENSVSPGDFISVYGTGLVGFFNAPADGSPAPSNPPALAMNWGASNAVFDVPPTVSLTTPLNRASWAGRAPGFAGVDQVNVQIPETVREGCAVPLVMTTAEGRSQPVAISVRKGGGACVDPPTAAYGQVTWERVIASGTSPSGEADVFTAAFPASPGKQAPPPLRRTSRSGEFFGPSCPVPGYRNLDAGRVTIQGPSFGPLEAAPAIVDGQTVYRAVLPNGTIRPGSFSVAASGATDVGPFESSVRIGSGININPSFPPGTVLPSTRSITVNWTGGDPDTWVTMKVLTHYAGYAIFALIPVRTSTGTATLIASGAPRPILPIATGPAEIILEVTPDPSQVPTLSAPGLSLGGQHLWKYTYRFAGLTIQ